MIDGVTGRRHHDAAMLTEQRRRDEQRKRWSMFCLMWGYIGAAIRNGY